MRGLAAAALRTRTLGLSPPAALRFVPGLLSFFFVAGLVRDLSLAEAPSVESERFLDSEAADAESGSS